MSTWESTKSWVLFLQVLIETEIVIILGVYLLALTFLIQPIPPKKLNSTAKQALVGQTVQAVPC